MAGELVPLVLIPRYTTLASLILGDNNFTTGAMDVTPYSSAIVTVWRGKLVGAATPDFKIWFEESTDQIAWSMCAAAPPSGTFPSENVQTQYTISLGRRWFRTRVELGGADNIVTCFAVGYLERRLP